jgi:hypothetical protein
MGKPGVVPVHGSKSFRGVSAGDFGSRLEPGDCHNGEREKAHFQKVCVQSELGVRSPVNHEWHVLQGVRIHPGPCCVNGSCQCSADELHRLGQNPRALTPGMGGKSLQG